MGFFDKIKSAVNVVTGGSADVSIEFKEVSFGEAIILTVHATAKSDLKIDKVYLNIRGLEEVNVDDVDYVDHDGDGDREHCRENVRKHHRTCEIEQVVCGAEQLEAGQSYQWDVEIQLPPHAQAPYHGHYCTHSYEVFAGLDAFGNDPDSGWVTIPF